MENTLQALKEKVFAEIENTDANKIQLIYRYLQLNSEVSVLHIVSEQLQTNKLSETTDSFEHYRAKQKETYKHLPIIWGEGKPDINDFTGIWHNKDITIE